MRNRHGMTLVEIMIALTVFSVVMAAALSFLNKQARAMDRSSAEMGMLQNLSFAGGLQKEEFRLAGANVPFKQPAVVYAGTSTFIFNADYASNTDSLFAVYYNPGLPAGQVSSLRNTQRFALSGTSPAYTYPDSNYFADGSSIILSPAETISWFFQLDPATAAPNDYILYRQVNDAVPEVVVRNVIQTSGQNFFRYHYKRVPATGTASATLDTVPTAWMPLRHTQPVHGITADTGAAARIDSLAAVAANFSVTNGLTGAQFRSRSSGFMVALPNIGTRKAQSCGAAPILGSGVVATWFIDVSVSPPDTAMRLTWNQAVDEAGGELDVRAYVIWRRNVGNPIWPDPIATVAAGPIAPSYVDQTAIPGGGGPGYEYGLAAQDCTPSLSTMATATPHITPP